MAVELVKSEGSIEHPEYAQKAAVEAARTGIVVLAARIDASADEYDRIEADVMASLRIALTSGNARLHGMALNAGAKLASVRAKREQVLLEALKSALPQSPNSQVNVQVNQVGATTTPQLAALLARVDQARESMDGDAETPDSTAPKQ